MSSLPQFGKYLLGPVRAIDVDAPEAEEPPPIDAPREVSASQSAFSEALSAFNDVMPILMHGSGDVVPDQVNPDTAQLLSELTLQYIANLVDAALDAQQLLLGTDTPPRPPPPRFPKSRNPDPPFVPPKESSSSKKKSGGGDEDSGLALKKHPRLPDVDYWDEPLPKPSIAKKRKTGAGGMTGSGQAGTMVARQQPKAEGETSPVPVDEWVGVAGVDLWENRTRAAYVRMPDAIGVQCFIFPICHDGFLYGKVMQVQASRRAIAPVLVDSVLLDLVRTEGALARKQPSTGKKTKDSGDADVEDEPEEEEEEEPEEEGATWPGLEFMLPVHTIADAANEDK